MYKRLIKMASPKKWMCKDKKVVLVDTPHTIRARELRDLYHALNLPMLSVDERLQILLHVKYTTKEFDCNLTREIVELIDREGDLVSRGRPEKSLEGI
jgi:IQ and ubiquitin-like domain-containing protein